MTTKISKPCLLCLAVTLCQAAYGNTITFDDLTGGGLTPNVFPPAIPNGYQGLNWNNLFVINTATPGMPFSGNMTGTVSPVNVAIIPDFTPQLLTPVLTPPAAISSTTPFILESGYFTASFLNGVTLDVTGLNGTTTEFDEKFTVSTTAPSFLTFPDLPVTELEFTTSGGDLLNHPYSLTTSQVAMDNLTVEFVPDAASTALLLAASVGGLAVLRKRFS